MALVICASLSGCGPRGRPQAVDRRATLIAVATIYPLYDWLRVLGGDEVEAHCLLRPGDSPHTYAPQPQDAQILGRAALLVMVGKGLEPWAEKLGTSVAGLRIIKLGEGIGALGDDEYERHEGDIDQRAGHDHPEGNPHVWLSPRLAIMMVERLAEALSKADPANADAYYSRSEAYIRELAALEDEMKARLALYRGRRVVTCHAAFDYLLDDVGLALQASIQPYPGKEPSARYLEALVTWMREHNVKTVFAEPQLSPKAANVIASEVGGKVVILDPLGDPADPGRDSYLKMMRYNTEQLAYGLGGE